MFSEIALDVLDKILVGNCVALKFLTFRVLRSINTKVEKVYDKMLHRSNQFNAHIFFMYRAEVFLVDA